MDTCTVEVGLLRKHACANPSVAKCANCEQPLCTKHALPQHSATGGKTGKFLCAQCNAAAKLYDETAPAAAPAVTAAAPAAAAAAPAAPKPAPPKPAPAKPAAVADDSGSLDFKPGEPPAGGKTELSIEHSTPPEPKPGEKK